MENKNKGTYNRKYYLHRRVKKSGCKLKLEETHKTVTITPEDADRLKEDKYLNELMERHQYGVQITNPMWNE
jgi:hypothetical protein